MRLSIQGFKGRDLNVDLGLFNLLSAPSGSGKTAIADAIRFLALGYVPALGKRHRETAALMRDEAMSVTLTLGDGRVMRRILERRGPSYKVRPHASWVSKDAKSEEHHLAILGKFGNEEVDVAEILDIRELLNATPNKRAARIEKLLACGGSDASVADTVTALALGRILGMDSDKTPMTWRDMVPLLPEAIRNILRLEWPVVKAKIEDLGLEAALEWINSRKREENADLGRKRAAREELETRTGRLITKEQAAALDEERSELDREIGARHKHNKDAEERNERLWRAQEALGKAETDLEALQEEKANPYGKSSPWVQWQKDAEQMEREAEEMKITPLPSAEDLEALRPRSCKGPWNKLKEVFESIIDHTKAKKAKALCQDGLRILEPYLTGGADQETWAQAKRDHQAQTAEHHYHVNLQASLHAQSQDLYRRADEAKREDKQRRSAGQNKDRDVQIAKGAIEAAKRLVNDLGPEVEPVDVAELSDRLAEIAAAQADYHRAEAARAQMVSVIEEIDEVILHRDTFAAFEWALQRARESNITQAGGSLLSEMSGFLAAAGREEQPYFVARKGTCEIGWRRDGNAVPIQALSGGEWVLFATALTNAVIKVKSGLVSILLVEAGETDDVIFGQLLRGIEASSDYLTSALVLLQREVDKEGWTNQWLSMATV